MRTRCRWTRSRRTPTATEHLQHQRDGSLTFAGAESDLIYRNQASSNRVELHHGHLSGYPKTTHLPSPILIRRRAFVSDNWRTTRRLTQAIARIEHIGHWYDQPTRRYGGLLSRPRIVRLQLRQVRSGYYWRTVDAGVPLMVSRTGLPTDPHRSLLRSARERQHLASRRVGRLPLRPRLMTSRLHW